MPEPVTTYILTFKSSVPDEQDRRANLNRFLKAALRSYKLRLVNMQKLEETRKLSTEQIDKKAKSAN